MVGMVGKGIGSQTSAPGQEALIRARQLGWQGAPSPGLQAMPWAAVGLPEMPGTAGLEAFRAAQLGITDSVPLSLVVHPRPSVITMNYVRSSALVFLFIEL